MAAIILLLLFGLSATHAVAAGTPSCAGRCPVDCPMHAKGRGCHHGAEVTTASADCHRPQARGPGWRTPQCTHRPDGVTTADQPAVLRPTLASLSAPLRARNLLGEFNPPAQVNLEPPFHPPPVLLRGL